MLNKCYIGDCREGLRAFVAAGLRPQMCVTSPPYWGLRDYGIEPSVWGGLLDCKHEWGDQISVNKGGPTGNSSGLTNRGANQARTAVKVISAGQFCQVFTCGAWLGSFGLEPDYRMYIDHMVEVMDLVREVLADDGTLWLNLGDSYATGAGAVGDHPGGGKQGDHWKGRGVPKRADGSGGHVNIGPQIQPNRMPQAGLKPKDLCLMPARVALALQEAGWWVRQDIIWHKPNPMPESVTDRCTKAHEYIFLLSKSQRYYYDAEAIRESSITGDNRIPYAPGQVDKRGSGHDRGGGQQRHHKVPDGWDTTVGDGGHGSIHKRGRDKGQKRNVGPKDDGRDEQGLKNSNRFGRGAGWRDDPETSPDTRNKRSVWTVTTQPFPDAHFATFPRRLIEPCILAGSRPGDVVLDPFMGSGTTAQVSEQLGRKWIGCEINPDYVDLQTNRLRQQHLELETDCQVLR